jgi:molybdate transport system substrate-binding protein
MTQATPIRLMCALAVRGAFDAVIVPDFQATGGAVSIAWHPTSVIMKQIAAGQTADALLVISDSMDDLVKRGIVDAASRMDVVQSGLGVAVASGAPHPDIGSLEAFQQTLLQARSVAYSDSGASGLYFKGLIQRLGIADAINAKATIIPSGFTAEKLVTGEADIAIQQVSELIVVDGIEIVGRFPAAVQNIVTVSAAVFTNAPNYEAARRFIDTLRAAPAIAAYRRSGLDPIER